jgi:hypothetical protein
MKKAYSWYVLVMLAKVTIVTLTLAFGLAVVGCDDGNDGSGSSGGEKLPEAKGVNALSGKTFLVYDEKIAFSVTAEGNASGTYTKRGIKYGNEGPVLTAGKYTWDDTETGAYTWDETAKTVTLKPEKVSTWGETGRSGLLDKAGLRKYWQDMLDAYKEQMGEAAFNAELAKMGFSSASAYLDAEVAASFANTTDNYAFSADSKVLFLDEPLPANKGTNELKGQTFYGMDWNNETEKNEKDLKQTYAFTDAGYTYTDSRWGDTPNVETGTYAYDSQAKRVYFKRPVTDREATYTSTSAGVTDSGYYESVDDAVAAQVNGRYYEAQEDDYNLANKTVGDEN